MRANRAYRLIVRRGGIAPALLADVHRIDHLEIVEIGHGEVVLFWDLPPRDASRLARALRADLSQLEASAFLARWHLDEGGRGEPRGRGAERPERVSEELEPRRGGDRRDREDWEG